MDSLTLKLVLTPTLIGAASLAGRRWGPSVSGWFVGLPFTSGPIAFFLALSQGAAFTHLAAIGTLTGALSQAAFCLAYAWLARHFDWRVSVLAGALVFAGTTIALQYLHLPLTFLYLIVLLALVIALYLMPRRQEAAWAVRHVPVWDLPARMVVATGFVIVLTSVAPRLGPHLTGLIAPFPLYAAVLAVFAHHLDGATPATGVLRGLLMGLFAFASFFVVLAALIERASIAVAFVSATLVALVFQGGSFWLLQYQLG